MTRAEQKELLSMIALASVSESARNIALNRFRLPRVHFIILDELRNARL
jgi:hypothetical protein